MRKYLLDVARYWIDAGIDGWRLDVPNEIDDDPFWADFRRVVRAANPDAYLVGEIWEVDPRWVGSNHFDGLMNYPVRKAILGLINGDHDGDDFVSAIQRVTDAYPYDNVLAMYSLLGSHDVERVRTMLGGSIEKTLLAFTLLFGLPGVPSIYYGDEIGMEGGRTRTAGGHSSGMKKVEPYAARAYPAAGANSNGIPGVAARKNRLAGKGPNQRRDCLAADAGFGSKTAYRCQFKRSEHRLYTQRTDRPEG